MTWPEKQVFCAQHIVGSRSGVHSVHLCLLIGELNTYIYVLADKAFFHLDICYLYVLHAFGVTLFLRCLVCGKSVGLL